MDLETMVDSLRGVFESITHSAWVGTAITIVITLVVTALASLLMTKLLHRLLHMSQNPLPASSIFINVARATIWILGICVILSSCFNVDISAAVTALGVGGIAISLGFQSTLSNLIGGLQISLGKLVKPGDHISVGSNEGIVHDVSWRQTVIVTIEGNKILVPNSVINSAALVKLAPQMDVRIDVLIKKKGVGASGLEGLQKEITDAVDEAVSKIALMKVKPSLLLEGTNEDGYTGLLCFAIGIGAEVAEVRKAALESIKDIASDISADELHPEISNFYTEMSIEQK